VQAADRKLIVFGQVIYRRKCGARCMPGRMRRAAVGFVCPCACANKRSVGTCVRLERLSSPATRPPPHPVGRDPSGGMRGGGRAGDRRRSFGGDRDRKTAAAAPAACYAGLECACMRPPSDRSQLVLIRPNRPSDDPHARRVYTFDSSNTEITV